MSGKRENERIRNKVVGMCKEFISDVDPRNVLDLLIQKGIITNETKDEVMNRRMRHDQCRALLDHLFYCSNDDSFIILREALRKHYPRIAERIDALDTDKDNTESENVFSTAVIDHSLCIEQQRERLTEIIEPESGVPGKLFTLGALTPDQLEQIQSETTRQKKNKMILDYIRQTGKYENLITALTDSCQTHVVNWIRGNGEYKDEFGLYWPLTDKEKKSLDNNYEVLVDLLDTSALLPNMYSQQIINNRQKDFIDSHSSSYKRNEALLTVVRRFSRKSYLTLLNCLKETKQGHIVDILENGGVIVRAHATLESNNLDEAETQIVHEMTNLLMNRTASSEQANRVLATMQLNIVAVKRGKSIILYIWCNKEEEFVRLCETIDNLMLRDTLEQLFNSLIGNLNIKVLSVTIKEKDIDKAKKSFEESAKEFESCAVVIGLEDDITISNDVLKINLNRSENVFNLQKMPTQINTEMAAAVYSNSVFVTGLGSKDEEIWRFDPTSSEWEYCTSMVQRRRKHSVAFVDHMLYICGGWVDSQERVLDNVEAYDAINILYICGGWVDSQERILDKVEAYDAINNKCSFVGKLVHAVHTAGNGVPFKASLYIFGGCDVDYNPNENVQVYDTKLNTCTLLSKPMPRAYSHLRAALWENSVILLGGDHCFVYDFDIETWEVRDQFKTDVFHFGLVINDNKVFVIGGGDCITDSDGKDKWICRDDVRCIPIENILKNEPIEWRHHAKLPKPSFVFAFGKMDFFVKNIACKQA